VKATRPRVGGAIAFLVFVIAISVFDRTTQQDGIAFVVFVAVCVAVIGWFFWSRRYT
jgi:UDP-N-acetylmuramyl pentapeptide phosphotransferase/UDP-N-acetylglucosamine-1-phosphate transferase